MKRGGWEWDWAKEQMQIRGSIEKKWTWGVSWAIFRPGCRRSGTPMQARAGQLRTKVYCCKSHPEIRADGEKKERGRAGVAGWTEGDARDGRARLDVPSHDRLAIVLLLLLLFLRHCGGAESGGQPSGRVLG
jgi:hypothetical protein